MSHRAHTGRTVGAAAIGLEQITKRFGAHTVIDDVSATVDEGEVVAIIGPSGAGKSTLLRCVNLLEVPDVGRLSISGEQVDFSRRPTRKQLQAVRRDTGMVFQSFNLFPHMTALRNVSLPQERVLGRTKAQADDRSMRLLARVGLAEKAQRPLP